MKRVLATVFSDLLMFNLSFLISYRGSLILFEWVWELENYVNLMIFANFTLFLVFSSSKLYGFSRSMFDSEEFYRILQSLLVCSLLITAATFLTQSVGYSRLILVNAFVISLFLISIGRSAIGIVTVKFRKKGFDRCRVAIIGDSKTSSEILRRIEQSPELGYDFVGFFELNQGTAGELGAKDVSVVFVNPQTFGSDELTELLISCPQVDFKIIPDVVKLISEPLSFDEFRDIPLVTVSAWNKDKFYLKHLKRTFDFVVSFLFLIIFLPLFVLIAGAIKAESKGPVLFKQVRPGFKNGNFVLLKFRTMVDDAEGIKPELVGMNGVNGLFKIKNDPRVTRVGYLLRRTCLDELPQIFNILCGDMSLVGPRPYLPEELKLFHGWRRHRFDAKPGLTGLWQISGRHQIEFDKSVLMDIYYIKHVSFLFDLKILLKTIPSIIFSNGRW